MTALRDVSLDVRPGEFLSLIGPSGCGKSTVLNMFAGLTPPTEGTILHDGRAVEGVNTRVGYVTQDDNLLPWRTTLANVEIALELKRCRARPGGRAALAYLGRVGLAGLRAPLSPRAVGRDAQARLDRPDAGGRERERHPDGRAARAARRADAAAPAGRAAPALAGQRPDHRLRDPRPGGGDRAVRPDRDLHQRARPHQGDPGGEDPARPATSSTSTRRRGSPTSTTPSGTTCATRSAGRGRAPVSEHGRSRGGAAGAGGGPRAPGGADGPAAHPRPAGAAPRALAGRVGVGVRAHRSTASSSATP